ncbi:hypothetical protein DAPPUDRAFT_248652 [Daphnia pulex]|uniref:Uncharacterized protein n=1 Tax=Daphnia pulex TaxID=6669 RepID=E9GUY0_DAPPU|nr:hypothetical protein DAPPUDRAFT_248652 [Daphnia pulex]|eukprot:EFX76711.1 hypothetical protein DAPPUDRAFT_248652 [Daphnia pulex]
MIIYLNTHAGLEQIRKKADADETKRGPIAMIVGPTDVGKSTVCKLLLNYAMLARDNFPFQALLVQWQLNVRPADVEEGFSQMLLVE